MIKYFQKQLLVRACMLQTVAEKEQWVRRSFLSFLSDILYRSKVTKDTEAKKLSLSLQNERKKD